MATATKKKKLTMERLLELAKAKYRMACSIDEFPKQSPRYLLFTVGGSLGDGIFLVRTEKGAADTLEELAAALEAK